MTDNELATRRMMELLTAVTNKREGACHGCTIVCDGCGDDVREALAELRRLGALYPQERTAVAKGLDWSVAQRVWPGGDWRAVA